MSKELGRIFARKLFVAVASTAAALVLVGGAYALTGEVAAPTEETSTPEATEPVEVEQEGEGEHGGTKPRIHDGCEGAEGLEGNWTHGDYVSAIAQAGDHEATSAAAKSDCGKVDHNAGGEDAGPGHVSRGAGKGHDKHHGEGRPEVGHGHETEATAETESSQ